MHAPDSWPGLLAADVPAGELQRHRARLLAEPGADRERVEADAAAAEEVHARLAAGRQQARELAVLDDLARRLVGLHDPADLLQEVAAQSRRLLGADVSYLMLRHPDGLRIEVSDGSMGSALRGIVLREGEGIGGEVLRTGRPVWTADYLADTGVRRLEHVDGAARSEQLGGILGVPLQVGGETTGVLLAADRRPRRFADHDVELLAALAAHAAVALGNAQLIADLRAGAVQLRREGKRRERAGQLREVLTAVVLAGGGVDGVARAVEQAVGGAVRVEDPTGARLDAGPGGEPAGWDGTPQRQLLAGSVLVPVVLPEGPVACLVASRVATDTDDEVLGLLDAGATSLALVVATERAVALAAARSRGEFLQSLLAGAEDDTALRRRGRAAGVDVDAVTCVAVLTPADAAQAGRVVARLADGSGSWSVEHAGAVVVLLPGPTADDVLARVGTGGLPAAVGLAPCAGGAAGVRAAHREAAQTAALLRALDRPGSAATAARFGVYRALLSPAGRGELDAFVDATLGPVLRWDADRGRDLASTVDVFLRTAQHHARTCAELHVHANTLYQRLERVTELLGPDWRDPDRVLQLQLALTLRRLAAEL
ncbi:helix-turn-helix domain-containing protein [Klenkia soli]|uniref:helix-turn-helix domain-containing protein n=1 Tax=Klenkia soli TaxID=1052260 RepID=UPI0010424E8F|nr:GAF domain-containing protein [Klenkia soli]